MSGGLAPSKSTVYVANIPFTFTNNDLHKIFENYGKVVKVTVVKDKITRKSKGVAFVLFLNRDSAYAAVRAINNKQIFGRQLKCSIAVDNGRAAEFIRRRDYVDKTRCFECGEFGHLSYRCPKNTLGEREPPKKKPKKKRRRQVEQEDQEDEEEEESDEGEDPSLDNLSAAIRFQQQLIEEEEYRRKVASGNYNDDTANTGESERGAPSSSASSKRKRFRPNNYFSDEEEELEDEANV